jgi:uncharacterized protein
MKIDVSELLKDFGAVLRIDESGTFDFKEDNLKLSSPVEVKLKLTNTGETVLVSGTLKTSAKLTCCRCCKEFEYPVNIRIDEEYAKKGAGSDPEDKEELELKDKDFVFEMNENNIIDLDEAVRQNIIVSLPIKPLCKKSCKLAVPSEGTKKKIDPRLAKLAAIKLTGGK